jgi:hypothetical protein
MYLQKNGSSNRKSANCKIFCPQIVNQQITTFVEGPKKNEVCKLRNCKLR